MMTAQERNDLLTVMRDSISEAKLSARKGIGTWEWAERLENLGRTVKRMPYDKFTKVGEETT